MIPGYGTDMHLAQLDSQHLLHCLNAVRKYSHYDYYYEAKWGKNMPPLHVAHRSHCIGVLFEALTCQPSLNVITFDWMETQHNPFPDFNINRKCVNWDEVTAWADKVEIKDIIEKERDMKRPEGAVEIPVLKQLLELDAQ